MNPNKSSIVRRLVIAATVIGALTVAVFVAYRFALGELRSRVLAALGPQSEIGEINLSLRALEITGLRIKAPSGWPAAETLLATRVVVVPELRSLFSDTLTISQISVDGALLTILRTPAGKLRLLPNFTENPPTIPRGVAAAPSPSPLRVVLLKSVALTNSRIEFFDGAVSSPPLRLTLDQVRGRISNIGLPDLAGESELLLEANLKHPSRVGSIEIKGGIELASRDSKLSLRLRDVAVAALEPYLIKTAETGVKTGLLDLDLTATVKSQRINAPAVLTLRDLALKPASGAAATFMGVPRDAFVNLMRSRDGRITVPFTVEGHLNDPSFSLHAAFKTRLGLAAAATLGISIKELIGGLGGLDDKTKLDSTIDAFKRLITPNSK